MKLPVKKPIHEDEDDDIIDVEVVEETPKVPRVAGKQKVSSLPIVQVLDDEEITDDEVVANIEAAINTASSFGRSVPTIRQHLRNRDYGSAAISAKGALLATLVDLLPIAEMAVRETKATKGIYQFNSLAGQMRELIIDLDGERDLENLVQSLIMETVEPNIRMFAQMLIQWNTGVKRELRAELDEANYSKVTSVIDEHTQALATYASQMMTEIRRQVERKVDKAS